METTEYKPTYEQLEKALEICRAALTGAATWHIDITDERIAAALARPVPTYEEVTVERWECDSCGEVFDFDPSGRFCGRPTSKGNKCQNTSFTKLTGTRRVPVKQPERKRVSVEAQISSTGVTYPLGVKARPEWQDHPECHGKTGTLTFEWPEE